MASLLVIGGSGFFGKSILSAYKRGRLAFWDIDNVKVVSRHATQLRAAHPELNDESIELYDLDVATCTSLPDGDYVIHAATTVDDSAYLQLPNKREQDIQSAIAHYCELARIHHSNSKIVYVSSGAVYGMSEDISARAIESQQLGNLDTLSILKQHYAKGKLEAESYMSKLAAVGLNMSIARCFAFVGEYLPRDGAFAIGNFLADGLMGRPIVVKAQAKIYRSYMYADDLVHWLMTIAAASSPKCPIYNVGSEEIIELKELAAKIAHCFGLTAQVVPELSTRLDVYAPDVNIAKRQLNLEITCSLDQAIHQTVQAIRLTAVKKLEAST